MSAAGQFVKGFLKLPCYRAGLTTANGTEVNLAQPDDLGRRSADKNFVGNVKLVSRNRFLDNGVSHVSSNGDQTVARDALEDGGRRGTC